MTRIRVDPANLRQAARQLSSIADRLRALGSEAHQAASRAPSYDGQFGPKARAMGMEAEARLRAQADRLSALSEELESRAAAFEAVDQETLTAFDRLTQLLRGWIEQAKPILSPYVQIALFPWQKVEQHLRLGYLIDEPVDENGEGEEEDEWSPPWWTPLMISLAEGWDKAVDASHNLSYLSLYGLVRASQAADDIVDAAWYGFPASGGPSSGLTGQLWMNGLTDTKLLNLHQHQYDGTESTPNDCATTSMSMVINQAFNLLGYQGDPAQHGEMAGLLDSAWGQIRRIYRVPASVPTIRLGQRVIDPRGAMPPGGTADALNQFANEMRRAGYPRTWTAEVSGHNTVDDLIDNIQNGNPTILYGVWKNGTPHAMVLAGYDSSTDEWQILDPGYPLDPNDPPQFRAMKTTELEEWWGRRYFAYQRNTTVVLNIDNVSSSITTDTPTAQPPPTPSLPGTEAQASHPTETPTPDGTESITTNSTTTHSPTATETPTPDSTSTQ